MMSTSIENEFIENLTKQFPRSPLQLNRVQESDAEVVRLFAGSETEIAVTTDSIVEEIAGGLYEDPYLAGWMTVMANMSDLAAVGAEPIGILISQVLPRDYPDTMLLQLQKGIRDACDVCKTYVLGGDTNFDKRLMLSGCALGSFRRTGRLSRIGSQPGDLLYSTNLLGCGNAYALVRIMGSMEKSIDYRPVARLREGQSLCGTATACMDTSDGVIATLDQLMRLNNVGFEFDPGWECCLHPAARATVALAEIPPWLLLAGQHGEFELLFTVPECEEERLLTGAERDGWQPPLLLGKVVERPEVRLPLYGTTATLDTARIRNLAFIAAEDVGLYVRELLNLDHQIQKGALTHADE